MYYDSQMTDHCTVRQISSDVKKALPGISLPRAATRADHLGKYLGTEVTIPVYVPLFFPQPGRASLFYVPLY